MTVTTVATIEQARRLAATLNDSARKRVVTVVTSPSGVARPFIDVRRLDEEVGDLADIYLLPTGDPSWEFSASMAPGTQVYGGAGRVYPIGLDWIHNLRLSPLRFTYGAADGQSVTTKLIGDTFSAAVKAGYGRRTASSGWVVAKAKVRGTPTDSQVLLQMPDGTYATASTAIRFPDLPADRLFTKGMTVEGRFDSRHRKFDLNDHVPEPGTQALDLPEGAVLPVRVVRVTADTCQVAVLPGLVRIVSRELVTGNPRDDLRDLLSADEIVLARVTLGGPSGFALSMLDVDDDDEARDALAIWPGGPPWLRWAPGMAGVQPEPEGVEVAAAPPHGPATEPLPADAPAALDDAAVETAASQGLSLKPAPQGVASPPVVAPAAAKPTPMLLDPRRRGTRPEPLPAASEPPPVTKTSASVLSLSLSLDTARSASAAHEARADRAESRIGPLTAELARMDQENADLRRQLDMKDKHFGELKTRYRSSLTKERRGGDASDDAAFLDPEDDFRWEVEKSWVRRIPAGEKTSLPLPPYRIGPNFVESLVKVQGLTRAKIADVVVEVLTDRAELNPGRELHQLRSGPGGDDAAVRVGDATCWRVALQVNSPSARRLHFWRDSVGVELSRVVLHDDFRP